jgi:hypothetical protein
MNGPLPLSGGFKLPGFLSAGEAAGHIGISPERLTELAEAGYAPHILIDSNPPPLFHLKTLKEWAREHLWVSCAGAPLPARLIVCEAESLAVPPPMRIRRFPGLREFFPTEYPPCVYFLIKGGCVVYVGQTVNLPSRIARHRETNKVFDRTLFLPVPQSNLDEVERALIATLDPMLNRMLRATCDADLGRAKKVLKKALNIDSEDDPLVLQEMAAGEQVVTHAAVERIGVER